MIENKIDTEDTCLQVSLEESLEILEFLYVLHKVIYSNRLRVVVVLYRKHQIVFLIQ